VAEQDTVLFRQAALVADFLLEGGIIGETRRVHQPQARKVAVQAHLFRSGGEQQHAGDCAGEAFYGLVARAGFLGTPVQVMGLVHHQQVPVRGGGGIQSFFVVRQQ